MSALITVLAWVMAGLLLSGNISAFYQVGKPRGPLTTTTALLSLLLSVVISALLVTR